MPLRGDPNEYETKDWSFYSARSDSSKARNTNETKRQHDTDLGRGGNCPRTKFFLCHAFFRCTARVCVRLRKYVGAAKVVSALGCCSARVEHLTSCVPPHPTMCTISQKTCTLQLRILARHIYMMFRSNAAMLASKVGGAGFRASCEHRGVHQWVNHEPL